MVVRLKTKGGMAWILTGEIYILNNSTKYVLNVKLFDVQAHQSKLRSNLVQVSVRNDCGI